MRSSSWLVADVAVCVQAAIRDPDPVCILENELLYGQSFPIDEKARPRPHLRASHCASRSVLHTAYRFLRSLLPRAYRKHLHSAAQAAAAPIWADTRCTCAQVLDKDFTVPIGKAKVQLEGTDITLVTFSKMVGYCLEAADKLKEEGISAEVINLRTLKPLDRNTILDSIKKTHKHAAALYVPDAHDDLSSRLRATLVNLGRTLLCYQMRTCSHSVGEMLHCSVYVLCMAERARRGAGAWRWRRGGRRAA